MPADYEHVPVPPDGRAATAWETENMLDSSTAGDVDYGDLDDSTPEWQRVGMAPDDGSGEGWFDSPQLDGMPLGGDDVNP